jgi:hypothetical protein
MARESGSKSVSPKAGINRLYVSDFYDIMGKTFGSAYLVITSSYRIKNAAEIARGLKEQFEESMFYFLIETEEYIDPKIRKFAQAYYEKGKSFDWTDKERAEKFRIQTDIGRYFCNQRLKKL